MSAAETRPGDASVAKRASRVATVFGGTGFLGRRIVGQLLEQGCHVRVAARHPGRTDLDSFASGKIEAVEADILDDVAVARAVQGASFAVNAVSLYLESGDTTYNAIHVEGARRLAMAATAAGLGGLVHLSGIGADASSRSPYIRSRADGEMAVRAAFPDATILRPSVMFGADDAFLNTLIRILRLSPVVPLFGDGRTRLRPAFVGDVAQAAVHALFDPSARGRVYEIGGPEDIEYRELIARIANRLGKRPIMVPVPFAIWHALAWTAAALPSPPLTTAQVALMARDNIPAQDMPGLRDLGVDTTPIDEILENDFALG
ncbi:complex I NDUFA9 subunit family protein [Limibaculum sp. M0105]|uniref:Complex I NDUFA9 subunit family protein n=1 Tax=Thermohalobaculum xanthum TaxID=2753746 RepID=A0A8J7M8A9_9RHOB|nr:complex I NDUFA9 subunit family protein [Thermohalobaculum xanthum]MBK0400154.1 complex I NDUFA9 subunit family protein [Thermohalobaculum xanthum]